MTYQLKWALVLVVVVAGLAAVLLYQTCIPELNRRYGSPNISPIPQIGMDVIDKGTGQSRAKLNAWALFHSSRKIFYDENVC